MEFNGEELIKEHKVASICHELLQKLLCDFVGIAIQKTVGLDVKWYYATGNRNDKYKIITVRYGKGLAGRVISTGSPIIVDHFPNNILGKPLDYPIMLAEKLVSAYGVPLLLNGNLKGVLLVGRRQLNPFGGSERQLADQTAKRLEEVVTILINH